MAGKRRVVVAGLALALTGCATATTAPRVVQPLAFDPTKPVHITDVQVVVQTGIWIKDDQRAAIRNKIASELAKQGLDAQPAAANTLPLPQTYTMKVTLTRFDEGNAMARLALIGLGQVHIEGNVALTDAAGQTAGQYAIKKTFAGGGIVGAVTTTENVEDGFAKSVVSGLKPQADEKKPADKKA